MIDISSLQFLLTLRACGTLVATARQLKITPSAATQRLQNIEDKLGVHLVERSARRLRFTDEGVLLCEHAGAVLAQYEALMESISQNHNHPVGVLKINAPFGFGRRYLAEVTSAFRGIYPEIEVVLTLSQAPLLELHHQFDVIIHIGRLPSSRLVARTIAPNSRFICASPDFINRFGAPESAEDLYGLPCLVLQENNEDASLWNLKRGRTRLNIRVQSASSSNDGDVIRQWALQGQGIIMRSQWDVAQDVKVGTLVRLLPDWQLPDAPVVALTHQRNGLPLRTRKFMAFLKEWFSPEPPWCL